MLINCRLTHRKERTKIFDFLKRRKAKTETELENKSPAVPAQARTGPQKPKAVAFVDYEYWLFSLLNKSCVKPDVTKWVTELKKEYDISDIRFYGDFSQEIMSKELNKIRQVSNQIIETKNSNDNFKKDFTDFILLDAIYQAAIFSKEIETFILFTGDGHFSSVAAFLKNTLHKSVIVYGIQDTFSYALKSASTFWHEIPTQSKILLNCTDQILKYLALVEVNENRTLSTFKYTTQTVAQRTGLDRDIVHASLHQLIKQGYIEQRIRTLAFQKQLRVLAVNWDKTIRDGLWNPDT
jgi:hypothetical protein